MKMPKGYSALLWSVLVVLPASAQPTAGMGVEDTPLRPSELKLMKRIAAVDPSFRYGDRVRRYFRIHAVTKNRIPLRVEMVLPQSNGLYFGDFISYQLLVDEPGAMVTYEFDSGTAHRGSGTILVTPRDVIKTERSCGTTSCQVRVERNGEVVYARKS
jgi:hypothetical protein